MECLHCACEVKDAKLCPVCNKPPRRRNRNKISIEIVEIPESLFEPESFSCPFCAGRQVKEVVAHENGILNVIYDLNKQTTEEFHNWAGLIDPRVVDTLCNVCGMSLPRIDIDIFIEESDEWLQ